MYWLRRVRKELLAYNLLIVWREELLEQLVTMDKGINPKQSWIDGMPRIKGGKPKSNVEHSVLKRDRELQHIQKLLMGIKPRIEAVERGLNALSKLEREVIRLSFHTVELQDEELASSLGLSDSEFVDIKYLAMSMIDHYILKPSFYV